MANQLDDTIQALGFAQVIVRVAKAANVKAADIAAHFVTGDAGQSSALAATATRLSSRRDHKARRAKMRYFPLLGLAIGYVDREGADALAKSRSVASMDEAPELSLIRPVATAAAGVKKRLTWGLERLGVPALWKQGLTGKGVLVGHLDTGVDGKHRALKGAIAAFAEFDLVGDIVPGAKAHDSDQHGTHTAGTILGRPVFGRHIGVAPGAKLVSGLVIEGGQVIQRVVAGMEWIVENKVKILSMSLGLRGFTPAFEAVTQALRDNGVLPVFAAGNEGPMTSRSPGNYDNVLSIGAFDSHDAVADFSSSQRFARPDDPLVPDLVGPGVDVLSCIPGGGYERFSGTSMATPHVAGVCALLLQAKPTATHADIEQAILASCVRPAAMPEGRGNRGILDPAAALTILTNSAPLVAAVAPRRRAA